MSKKTLRLDLREKYEQKAVQNEIILPLILVLETNC